jgi:formylmethanofuran dehydrogenase subunit C
VSAVVTLTLRSALTGPIDADCIAPDRFATLDEAGVAALPVWSGRRQLALGDLFDVRGGHASRVRVVGNVRLAAGIGTGMSGGEIVIDGDAGARTGAGLTGGHIEVVGSAGDDAGMAMTGGTLHIRRDAGARVGGGLPGASRGQTGGEIVVGGSVGVEAGARMRRGLLFVAGDAGDRVARSIIAGTVIVIGRTGREPAFASKRGTLVAAGGIEVPATYRYACSYEPPHVRLALTYLRRRYAIDIDPRIVTGRYQRYCGDAGTVGRGEILEWLPQ